MRHKAISFELLLIKLFGSNSLKTLVCFTKFQKVCNVITETRPSTTPIKFPRVFTIFQKRRGSLSLYRCRNWVKISVSYASFLMLRVGVCLGIRRASFTRSCNVVYVRPITVKQSLVDLLAQLLFSSRYFKIYRGINTSLIRITKKPKEILSSPTHPFLTWICRTQGCAISVPIVTTYL